MHTIIDFPRQQKIYGVIELHLHIFMSCQFPEIPAPDDKYLIADDYAYILGGRNTNNLFLGNYADSYNEDRDILVYETFSGFIGFVHSSIPCVSTVSFSHSISANASGYVSLTAR